MHGGKQLRKGRLSKLISLDALTIKYCIMKNPSAEKKRLKKNKNRILGTRCAIKHDDYLKYSFAHMFYNTYQCTWQSIEKLDSME
jgi:hypothetical protein